MAINCTFVENIGTEIILDLENDITQSTVFKIHYKKPNNLLGFWLGALFETDKIKYVTVLSSLDVVGDWILQAYVSLPDWKGYGCPVLLNVKAHI